MKNRNPIMRLSVALVLAATAVLFFSGCENATVGVGFSGYSNGMGYSFGVSQGPYGTHGYSGMSMYGRF